MTIKLHPLYICIIIVGLILGFSNLVSFLMVVSGSEPTGFFLGGSQELKVFNFVASVTTCYWIFILFSYKKG